MSQRLHLVFGGELINPAKTAFKDVDNLDIVGIFPDYQAAYDAWNAAHSARLTTHTCDISLHICTACATKRQQQRRQKNWITDRS